MAMPVIKGEKTADERFPGAVTTLSIEAMMQDRKALQAGTSHFLGQNFSKAQEIKFQSQEGKEEYAWTTSWGVSTRLVGALVMTHGDDDGLVLPPKLAPKHVVILPIYRSDEERTRVLEYCNALKRDLEQQSFSGVPVQAFIDDRDIRGGEKAWQHIKRGVPIRAEVGPRDLEAQKVVRYRRDRGPKDKEFVGRDQFLGEAATVLDEMQKTLFQRALALREENSRRIDTLDDFRAFFPKEDEKSISGGFALCHFTEGDESMKQILAELKVTPRCIPLDAAEDPGKCIFTGQPSKRRAVFAKAY
jgi:prolyl-tRNA synthetase